MIRRLCVLFDGIAKPRNDESTKTMMILAQTITPPSSGDFWNPTNWVQFVEKIGVAGFFALVLFGFFIWFLWRALTKWEDHLNRSEDLTKSQLKLCKWAHGTGGIANNENLEQAAHAAADAMQTIADGVSPETGRAAKQSIDKIHEKLRVTPPFPEFNGQG